MTSSIVRKTSDAWHREIHADGDVVIIDPDGWDRRNFEVSYYQEEITLEEFNSRIQQSTLCYKLNGTFQ